MLDLSFVRGQVAHTYGRRGNKSVPPEVILRMMLLLFLDDIKSERELMRIIPERLDYLKKLLFADIGKTFRWDVLGSCVGSRCLAGRNVRCTFFQGSVHETEI